MTQETTKKKARFSVVDFVIILLVLAFAVGIVARYDLVNRLFPRTSLLDADVTVTAEGISREEAKRIANGSVLHCGGEMFGTVRSVSSVNAVTYYEDGSGILRAKENPQLCDLTATVSLKVSSSENGYLLNGEKFISAGSEFTVECESVSVKITVLGVKTAD